MAKFVCDLPCFHDGHRFKKGEYFTGAADDLPKDKDGNLHHFSLVEGDNPIATPATPVVSGPQVIVNGKLPAEDVPEAKKKSSGPETEIDTTGEA